MRSVVDSPLLGVVGGSASAVGECSLLASVGVRLWTTECRGEPNQWLVIEYQLPRARCVWTTESELNFAVDKGLLGLPWRRTYQTIDVPRGALTTPSRPRSPLLD